MPDIAFILLYVETDVPPLKRARLSGNGLYLFHFSTLWEFLLGGYSGRGEWQRGGDGDAGGFEQSADVVARLSPSSRIRPKTRIRSVRNQWVNLKGLQYGGGVRARAAAVILGGGCDGKV